MQQFTTNSVPMAGIEASGPNMLLQLQQDGSGSGDGFTARFVCAPPSPPAPVGAVPVMLIKGVMDLQTPQRGASGKAVQLYAVTDVPDLSIFGLGVANNGGGTDGNEVENLPSISLSAGQSFWCVHSQAISRQGVNPFALYFGDTSVFATGNNNVDYHIDTSISQNGDDAIELFYNGDTAADIVDLFGDINQDGTGEPWDYRDAWAYRLDSVNAPATTFDIAEWTIATRDCSDSSTNNCDSPCGVYPAFECAPPPPPPNCVESVNAADGTDAGAVCAIIEVVAGAPAGYDTYLLKANLATTLSSIFAIFGDADSALMLPPAWNSALPEQLGAVGGFAGAPPTVPAALPGAALVPFDSYLAIGSAPTGEMQQVPSGGQPGGPVGSPWVVSADGMGTAISAATYGSNGASISTYPTCTAGGAVAGCSNANDINPNTVPDADGNVIVGQVTIPTGTYLDVTLNFQGKIAPTSCGVAGCDARTYDSFQARALAFNAGTAPPPPPPVLIGF